MDEWMDRQMDSSVCDGARRRFIFLPLGAPHRNNHTVRRGKESKGQTSVTATQYMRTRVLQR